MKKLLAKVKGYKTYAACVGMVLFAGLGLGFSYLSAEEAGKVLLEALALAGLRHSI